MFCDYNKEIKPYVRQYMLLFTVNLNLISVGMSVVWTSPMLVKLFDTTKPVLDKPITLDEASWMVSLPLISCLIANFLAGHVVNTLGRRNTVILAVIPKSICFAIITFTNKVWIIILAKVISGFGVGFIYIAIVIYGTEISCSTIRGRCVTISNISMSVGSLVMMSAGPYFDYFTVNVFCLALTVLCAIPLLFLPESPNMLFRKGNHADALKTLTYFRCSSEKAKLELEYYSASKEDEKITFRQIIKSKIAVKYLIIVTLMGIWLSLTGRGAIYPYLQIILISTKTNISSEIMSLIIGFTSFIGLCCSFLTVDKFGRKPVAIVSMIGPILGFICLGTFFKLTESGKPITGLLNYLPLASIILMELLFCWGIGSTYPVICAELFDGRTRGIAMSFCLTSETLTVFILSKILPMLNEILSPAIVFWMFAAFSSAFFFFIIKFIPETKGKSFVEIQLALERGNVLKMNK